MAWTAPMTAVAGSVFTAAQFNTFVRDNLNECPAAKATTPKAYYATSATNQVSERIPGQAGIFTAESTTTTSYTDLTTLGPQTTVTTGIAALVFIYCFISNNTAGVTSWMSFDVSGASTVAAADIRAISFRPPVVTNPTDMRVSAAFYIDTLTPGSNIFTAKYRASSGTANFDSRRILVLPY